MPGRGRGRPPHPDILTPAEQRVLEELRRGGTNVEIAVRLGLSPETVKTHIASMLGKLGLDDRHTLASWRPDRDRRRPLGLLALPPALASFGRPFLWAGAALGGMAIVAVAVVLLVALLGGAEDEHIVPLSTTQPVCPPAADASCIVTCDSGVAVPEPATNTELVEDCEILLAVKDRLADTATLNWTAGRPMTSWTGVTIAGTPQRVAKLDLADSGLTGEIPPALGDLTALTELRLNDNELTARIPSKLSQPDHLTHIYLAGNSLTGCLPSAWSALSTTNDFQATGLALCDPPEAVHEQRNLLDLEGGQTVTYQLYEKAPALTVDLPEGYTYNIRPITGEPNRPGIPSRTIMVLIYDAEGNRSWVSFDPHTGEEFYRYIHGEGGRTQDGELVGRSDTGTGSTPSPLNKVFDDIANSAWLQE